MKNIEDLRVNWYEVAEEIEDLVEKIGNKLDSDTHFLSSTVETSRSFGSISTYIKIEKVDFDTDDREELMDIRISDHTNVNCHNEINLDVNDYDELEDLFEEIESIIKNIKL